MIFKAKFNWMRVLLAGAVAINPVVAVAGERTVRFTQAGPVHLEFKLGPNFSSIVGGLPKAPLAQFQPSDLSFGLREFQEIPGPSFILAPGAITRMARGWQAGRTALDALSGDGRAIRENQNSGGNDRFLSSLLLHRYDQGRTPAAASSEPPVVEPRPGDAPQEQSSLLKAPEDGHGAGQGSDGQTSAEPEARFMATRIAVSPRTFQIVDNNGLDLVFDVMKGIKDPQERFDVFNAYQGVFDGQLKLVLWYPANPKYVDRKSVSPEVYKHFEEEVQKDFEALKAGFPALMQEHFESTLARYEHSVEEKNGIKVYSIPRGLEFWSDFVSSADPNKRMAALAFVNNRMGQKDAAFRAIKEIVDPDRYASRVLDSARLSPAEVATLAGLADRYGLSMSRHDRYIQLGGGVGFHVLRQVFAAAQDLADPVLIARFSRIVRFLAAACIGVVSAGHQGAAAYYTPLGDEMAYVMPSRGDLDTTTHELNHARFSRFEDRLGRWLKAKGYVLPYELDGPSLGFLNDFGAFLNLFNELNSWRIGGSFGDKLSDFKILGHLRQAYGIQVGWDNVRLFSETWNAAKVAGKSVPRLILDGVRRLNRVKNEDLASFGQEALGKKDVVNAHNFLRLVEARYPKLEGMDARQRGILEHYAGHPDSDIAHEAQRLLNIQENQATNREGINKEAELALILDFKTPYEVKLRRLVKIIGWALTEDNKKTVGRRESAIKLLQTLFEKWGWEPIREQESRGPEGGEKYRNRAVQPGHIFFSDAIDRLLAHGLFDQSRSNHRRELVNLISAYTYPQELPRVHRRLLQVIASDHPNKYDFWLARIFLIPEVRSPFAPHIAWGEDVVRAVQDDKTPNATALEFAGEFYRTGLNYSLPGVDWGQSPQVRLDAETRAAAEADLLKMSELQRTRYQKALEHLWLMLGHQDSKVRTSARYAAAAYPGYLIGLEDKLIEGLKRPPSALRLEVVTLISMTGKGFLPKVDEFLASGFSPTSQEAESLAIRR